jgi:ABC-type phosphate transport system substrate-binding protein
MFLDTGGQVVTMVAIYAPERTGPGSGSGIIGMMGTTGDWMVAATGSDGGFAHAVAATADIATSAVNMRLGFMVCLLAAKPPIAQDGSE